MEAKSLALLEFSKVLGLLSRLAVTEAGRDACLHLAPMDSPEQVSSLHAFQLESQNFFTQTGFRLQSVPDVGGLFHFAKASVAPLDIDGLWALSQFTALAVTLRTSLDEARQPGGGPSPYVLLNERVASLSWPAMTVAALKRCLHPEGGLRDEASPELYSARQEIRRLHQQLSRQAREFAQREDLTNYLQDDFVTISSDRYVLPLKTNFKGRVEGIVHDYSQTGETCYIEPLFFVGINNKLAELKNEERQAEIAVITFLSNLVRQEYDGLFGWWQLLVDLDVRFAVSLLAEQLAAVTPEVGGDEIELRRARHPLLDCAGGGLASACPAGAGKSKTGGAAPLDILLSSGQRALIVSGANASGKTVCLKTLGLLTIMALSGLPVPAADGARVPFFRDIFVFMGDEQSLEDHVSTFTAQIHGLASVWDRVGQGSLILLDEFGAGTDPSQGAALAQAVVDESLSLGGYLIAATHFPALKAYGLTTEGARSASMLFDPVSKRPLFSMAYDQVGASDALDVAERHGLPASVLSRARRHLLMAGEGSSEIFTRLNELAVSKERELADMSKERFELKKRRAKLSEDFEREKRAVLLKLHDHAKQLLEDVKRDKIDRKKAMKELTRVRREAEGASLGEGLAPEADGSATGGAPRVLSREDLTPGLPVFVTGLGRQGQVTEIDPRKDQAKIDLGGVSVWVKFSDLTSDKVTKPKTQGGSVSAGSVSPSMSLRLDLRGMRADDAVDEVARFLDQALLSGLTEFEIIHGKGSGALRKVVGEYLRTQPVVESFVLANEERGGDGVTVVTLAD